MSQRPGRRSGFTIIELLIAMFVISVVVTGVFGLFVLNLRLAGEAERRVVALALANERSAMVRNLPYSDVGTVNGVPPGSISQSEQMERNGVTYTVNTDIRYVDDVFDGTAGGGGSGGCVEIAHYPSGNAGNCQDLCVGSSGVNAHLAHGDSTSEKCDGSPIMGEDVLNTDYKQVRIEVLWDSVVASKTIVLLTHVAPPGFEGSEAFGTLDFLALDASGVGVEGATVKVVNDEVDPEVDITTLTNSEGRVVLPGLPLSANSYFLSVEKAGLVGEQTYEGTETFIPHPQYEYFSALVGELTSRTFSIDQVAQIVLHTRDDAGAAVGDVSFRLLGTKTIGVDDEANDVYRIDINDATDASGDFTASDLVWDSYDLTIDGAAAGYDIKETSKVLPFTVNPGEVLEVYVDLIEHEDSSLHVTVVDQDGAAVNDATVHLTGTDYDETLSTGEAGQAYFVTGNGSYNLEVTAAGWVDFTAAVEIVGTSDLRVELVAE